MAFSRSALADLLPLAVDLTAQMAGIGMNFATHPRADADIEATLVHASACGMVDGDLRALSVSHDVAWRAPRPRQRRSARAVRGCASFRARARVLVLRRQLAPQGSPPGPARQRLPWRAGRCAPGRNRLQIKRRGEDERFVSSKLRVPRGTLRDREDDVLSPEALVRRHAGYRNRVLMGPTWRADVWTVLEHAPDLSVAEVARRVSCSFATAWQAAEDFRLLRTVIEGAP